MVYAHAVTFSTSGIYCCNGAFDGQFIHAAGRTAGYVNDGALFSERYCCSATYSSGGAGNNTHLSFK
jgi:hypothetical protein